MQLRRISKKQRPKSLRTESGDRWRQRLARALVAIQFLMLSTIGIVALTEADKGPHNYLAFEIGSLACGLLVIGSAGWSLRPSLRVSPIPKPDAPLIQTGIYKYARHPMYLGVILIGFGMAGYADSWLSWASEFILIINLNIKARFEDALLLEIHPQSLHYQLHVSRILPCLGGSCRSNCELRRF